MLMIFSDDRIGANHTSWSYANQAFNARKGNYAAAIKKGKRLPRWITMTLDPNPTDKILHLLCNDGREAAALSVHFGSQVDGVDFSQDAIDYACELNSSLSLSNEFTAAEVYCYLEESSRKSYDKIILTLGSVRWLPELERFFRLCWEWLRPNGSLFLWEFHPLTMCLGPNRQFVRDYPLEPRSYWNDNGVRDYVGTGGDYIAFDRKPSNGDHIFQNPHPVFFSEYGCGNIINAAISSRFTLVSFHELEFTWEERYFAWLVADDDDSFAPPPSVPQIPLTFLLHITKP